MKKVEFSKEFSVTEHLENNTIKPNGNEKVNAFFHDSKLALLFENNTSKCQRAYLVTYDKKTQNSIACNEISIISENEFEIRLQDEFVRNLATYLAEYVRLCVLLVFDNEYAFFFLNHTDDVITADNEYVGTVNSPAVSEDNKLIVYYSAGGLLSMKFISAEQWLHTYVNNKVTNIQQSKDAIRITVNCDYSVGNSWDIVLCKRIVVQAYEKIVTLDKVSVNLLATKRQEVVADIPIDKLLLEKQGTYFLICTSKNLEVPLVLSCEEDILQPQRVKVSDNTLAIHLIKNGEAQLEIQVAEKIYPYIFSIVMAVHNTELYLEEALESILAQSINFENYLLGILSTDYSKRVYENIYQVILVDDGSTDSSGDICDRYAEKYDHIMVIHQENAGVSAARNTGLKYAQGKYINFMDSDDRFSENVLEDTFAFFEEHYDEMEALAFPAYFFDASEGEHWLNNKFKKGNRVINLWEEHTASLIFVNSTIYKGDVLREKKHTFDTELVTSEDIKFNYELLMECGPRIGVIDSCIYWYRRRGSGDLSAMQISKIKEEHYTKFLTHFIESLLESSNIRYGCVPRFVQSVIMQQLQWRFVEDPESKIAISVLGKEGFEAYKQHILKLAAQIDDDIILEQKRIFIEHKAFVLRNKYQCLPRYEYYNQDVLMHYGNTVLTSISKLRTQVDLLQIDNGILRIEGSMNFLYVEDANAQIYLKCADKYIACERVTRQNTRWSLGQQILTTIGFCGEIDLTETEQCEVEICCEINGQFIAKKNIKFGRRAPLNVTYKNAYYCSEKWVVKYEKGRFLVENIDTKLRLGEELQYETMFTAEVAQKANNDASIQEALKLRKQYMTWKMLNYGKHRKQIWLISDRPEQADDNGEVFFGYMLEKHVQDVEFYFVINEDSKDYSRLATTHKVIVQNSEEYKMLHLMADVIVSSQGNEFVADPFMLENKKDIFRDITYRHKYIFLQHGVIKDDLSKWLNRYEKNIDGFITSAKPEYQSIITGNYGYSEKQVWLTGLPRYDKLYHNEQRVIVVMPTWRKYVLTEDKNISGKFYPAREFIDSSFYEFYNALFQDSRLIDALERYGYQMVVKMHPLLDECTDLFTFGKGIQLCSPDKRYVDLFAEAKLLITDYSSTAMDFAYLNKPVLYCQFDKADFFAGEHMYEKGYFEYERDGFGDVVYDLDSCVEQIIKQLENGCEIQTKYLERINGFFEYQDQNNCERIYQKIIELMRE